MCKLCVFIIYEGDLDAFIKTVDHCLSQTVGIEDARLVIIFDKLMYELDKLVLLKINSLKTHNLKCLFNVGSDDLLKHMLAEVPDDGFFFVLREGDVIDADYLVYINYFFEENNEQCDVLLTPVTKSDDKVLSKGFVSLPYNGIQVLKPDSSGILPSSIEGVVFSTEIIKNISLEACEDIGNLFEIMIKAIVQKGCYGIINTVAYISDKTPQNHFNSRLLIKLADYGMMLYGEVPMYLIDSMSEYISGQLDKIDDFDNEIILLRKYVPYLFNDLDVNSFSLYITDVRNHFLDVEVVGTYTRARWDTDTKLIVSASTEVIYDEKLGNVNKWMQEVHFRAVAHLENDYSFFQFGIQTFDSFNFLDTISFDVKDEYRDRINNYNVFYENEKLYIKKIAPRAYYKVSCIIPVYNGEDYLKESIESLISQTIDFFYHIQILLVNNGSTDNTEKICLEYVSKYPYNISYSYLEEPSVSKARNCGLQNAMGEYISFLDADDKLPPNFMETGITYLNTNEQYIDMVAFPIEYFGGNNYPPKPSLNFRFTDSTIVDVLDKPEFIQFSACSALIKRSAVQKISFNEDLGYSEDADFVHKIILSKMKYGVVKEPSYLYRKNDKGFSATQSKKDRLSWYMRNTIFAKALIDYSIAIHGCVTQYTQNLIIHELSDNLIFDIPGDVASQLNIPVIMDSISDSLSYVEDEVIEASASLRYWFKYFLLKLKYQGVVLQKKDSKLGFYYGKSKFKPINDEIYITAISEINNRLYVSGFYNLASYDGIELAAVYNGQAHLAVITENFHKNIYFLGEPVHKASIFDFEIPLEGEGNVDFCFQIKEEKNYPVKLVFSHNTDKENIPSFFIGENMMILSASNINRLSVEVRNYKRLSEMISIVLKSYTDSKYEADKHFISQYLNMYSIMSKSKIWLFMDELRTANGNSEKMFRYCSKIKDNIEKYFIIDKTTLDSHRLESYGTVIQYGSEMHKLLYLFAEKIIVSNVLDNKYDPFVGSPFYSIYYGIMRAEIVYLPNEVQTEDMSAKINRFTRNLSLYAVSSDTERDFILNNAYGYGNNIVKTIGLPKYDSFIDKNQKKIIFMPSWRKSLYLGENKYNFDFSNSEYCKKISELLCDERLLEAMMENDYEMYFVPHEKVYLQIADFDMYENVNVIPLDFKRQELFEAGALMITDWMPVFDFVYMKKPVIYYRFAEEEAGMSIDNGFEFGETILDIEALVDKIIFYIQSGCALTDRYMQQIDKYFKYTDSNNCERIYSILKE